MSATPRQVRPLQPGDTVAVLMGGRSAEREISLMSGGGVLQALQSQGVKAIAFDPAEHPLERLQTLGVTRAFIALHGRYGEDGTVQGLLELMQIPYTGSGVLASSVAMNKLVTKQVLMHHGVATPAFAVYHQGDDRDQPAVRRRGCRPARAAPASVALRPARSRRERRRAGCRGLAHRVRRG